MSRLAKNPIQIIDNVEVKLDGSTMIVKGPKGELSRELKTNVVALAIDNGTATFSIEGNDMFTRSLWGTYASHLTNMMVGVTEGYQKTLEVEGVGFRWELKGSTIVMQLGFSHPVEMDVPEGIIVTIDGSKLTVAGIDKELVGAFAAKIRDKKKPEPYKGKGIRYQGEYIRRKQGKKTV
mgnify:CR=1 FL=1